MTRKRKTKSADSAIRPPVLDLEATEVAETHDQEAPAAETADDIATTEAGKPASTEPADEEEAGGGPDEIEVASETNTSSEAAADTTEAKAAAPARVSGHKRLVTGAVVVGLLAAAGSGAWLYRDYGEQWFGSPATNATLEALQTRLAAVERAQSTAGQHIAAIADKVQAANDGLTRASTELAGLSAALKEVQQTAKANDTTIADLQGRLDGLATSSQQSASDIAGLKTALAAAAKSGDTSSSNAATVSLQLGQLTGNVDALGQRVKTLEDELGKAREALSKLSTRVDDVAKRATAPQAGSKAAKIATAFSELETRIGEGKPFGAEVDTLVELDPNLPGLTALKAASDKGVPGVDGLARQLDDALAHLSGVSSKSSSSGQDSWWGALRRRFFNVVKVRRIGAIDWHEAGAKAKAALARDDMAGAIAAFGPITDSTPPAIASWLESATARKQVLDRLSALSAAVLQSLKRNAS